MHGQTGWVGRRMRPSAHVLEGSVWVRADLRAILWAVIHHSVHTTNCCIGYEFDYLLWLLCPTRSNFVWLATSKALLRPVIQSFNECCKRQLILNTDVVVYFQNPLTNTPFFWNQARKPPHLLNFHQQFLDGNVIHAGLMRNPSNVITSGQLHA